MKKGRSCQVGLGALRGHGGRGGRWVSSWAHLSIASSMGGQGWMGGSLRWRISLRDRQAVMGARGACRSEGLVAGEHVPDRLGEPAGEVDLGDLGAALLADARLRPLVAVAVGGMVCRRGWSPRSAPSAGSGGRSWLSGPRRSRLARLVDARAEPRVAGELARARGSGRCRRSRRRSCRRAPSRCRGRWSSSGT